MQYKHINSSSLIILLTVTVVALILSFMPSQEVAQSTNISQTKQKKLRDRAFEQDVEVEGVSEAHAEYSSFDDLTKEAQAIVYGRIADSNSFFDPSGHPQEYGEVITTEYTIEVYQVLRDRTRTSLPQTGKLAPAPLTTALKIARNGGTVLVNGHRASVKVKGYENLDTGRAYVFFLFWSPDYNAYVLAGGISGAVLVRHDMSLKALASSKEIEEKVKSLKFETLINQIN